MTQAKSILITGCSSGIGLVAANTLKKRGWRVFATARKQTDVETLRRSGLEAEQLDVSDETSIERACQTVLDKTNQRLDALFNNAGNAIPGAIVDLSRDAMRQQFETNVFGAMSLINHLLPSMLEQRRGRIVQNSSILGFISLPYYGVYNASKHALEGFSDTLRQELHGTGVHISIIEPGPIKTAFKDNAEANFDQHIDLSHSSNQTRYEALKRSQLKPPPLVLPPEKVVDALIHAIESPSPKSRYPIGTAGKSLRLAKRLLSDAGLDWLARQIMGKELMSTSK